jgi:hypothetical protein
MKINRLLLGLVFSFLLGLVASPVMAQSNFTLNVHRNIGYSSGSQIRGSFNMAVVGPNNIKSATFMIDGQTMKVIAAAPFSFDFNTSDYPFGWHDLSANILTTDGQTLTTTVRRFEFATSEEETAAIRNIVVPMVGGLLVVILIVVGVQVLFFRNKTKTNLPLGAPRNYGITGGAVCPKCHRPFPLSLLSLNIGLGTKFTRCVFCGKWSMVRRASLAELRAAESAELAEAQPGTPIHEKSEAEKLKEMLDNSRFTDKP